MGEHFNFDGSVLLYDDADPARTLVVAASSDLAAARLSFFGQEPAARPLIRKSTAIRRAHEAGILTNVMSILDMPQNAYAKARWWAPDWPEVYCDDPEAVAVVQAAGGDPATILAPE
jgi:hypothetical protein